MGGTIETNNRLVDFKTWTWEMILTTFGSTGVPVGPSHINNHIMWHYTFIIRFGLIVITYKCANYACFLSCYCVFKIAVIWLKFTLILTWRHHQFRSTRFRRLKWTFILLTSFRSFSALSELIIEDCLRAFWSSRPVLLFIW